jgi:hypothetical protein
VARKRKRDAPIKPALRAVYSRAFASAREKLAERIVTARALARCVVCDEASEKIDT